LKFLKRQIKKVKKWWEKKGKRKPEGEEKPRRWSEERRGNGFEGFDKGRIVCRRVKGPVVGGRRTLGYK